MSGGYLEKLRVIGLRTAIRIAIRRALGRETLPWFAGVASSLLGKSALEIGGPSMVFYEGCLLPVYPLLARCDNLDFSSASLWTPKPGTLRASPHGASAQLFHMEATALTGIRSNSYDMVLSSHMIEHTANPLGALREWYRVVVPGGLLFLVVPDKERTFDHFRPLTSMDHIAADAKAERGEDDMTHLEEVLRLHDLHRDPAAGTREAFGARCHQNPQLRAMHHHVFDLKTLRELVEYASFEVVCAAKADPFHLVIVARRPGGTD